MGYFISLQNTNIFCIFFVKLVVNTRIHAKLKVGILPHLCINRKEIIIKYFNNIPAEQETNINISYYDNTLQIYSSRKSVIVRLSSKLGEPTKKYFVNKSLTGASWLIPFDNKKDMNTALSKTLLIGQMKNE